MNKIAILATSAGLSLCVSLSAFAQTAPTAPLTRSEVRQQLIDAEAAGLLPINNVDYPPSADTVQHNQVLYKEAETFDARHPNVPTSYTSQAPDTALSTAQN
ncbi:Purine nucleoside phosphorylase [Pararobbsia alpina]|jgi:hypothetical protein|uniref:DUF4148 domain-containing protein n=1 Tax=Pararobbsia alpina TaxID=621374 RepID=UPI0039A5C8FD